MRQQRSEDNWLQAELAVAQCKALLVRLDAMDFGASAQAERKEIQAAAVMAFRRGVRPHLEDAKDERLVALAISIGRILVGQFQGDRSANIEEAIVLFRRALDIQADHKDEYGHATTLMNLGLALQDRLVGDRSDNIERAIACYEAALTVQTRAADEYGWLQVQTNLGTAFYERLAGDRSANIEAAIACYRSVLRVQHQEADARGWATVQLNLAAALTVRIVGDHARNIDEAIDRSQQALEVFTRDMDTHNWTLLQMNLGNAFLARLAEDRSANIERAINCYRSVLEVRTVATDPQGRALANWNLGNAFEARHEGRRSENVEAALQCYASALAYLRADHPYLSITCCRAMASLHLERGDRAAAKDALRSALDLRRSAFHGGSSGATRGEAARRADGVSAALAELLVKDGDVAGAAAALERGRAAGLHDSLRMDRVWLSGLSPDARARIERSQGQLRGLRQAMLDKEGDWHRHEEAIKAAELTLQRAIADAGFVPPLPPDADGLLNLAPNDGALVQLALGDENGLAVLLPAGTSARALTDQHVVHLAGASRDAFSPVLSAWHAAQETMICEVGDICTRLETANEVLTDLLDWLWTNVMGPVTSRLRALGLEAGSELVLLPQGPLSMVPLHAARSPDGRYVLDQHVVRYAPAGFVLETAYQRLAALPDRKDYELFGVFNPMGGTADALPLAESDELAGLTPGFGSKRVRELCGPDATPDRVLAEASGHAYLHFACHGTFDPARPDLSGLQLAGGAHLTVDDILQQLQLEGSRMVVLSACQTGLADVRHQPDEYVGLPAAFLQAGAPGVLATFWSVLDKASCDLVCGVYARHLAGATPARALQGAIRALRETDIVISGPARGASVVLDPPSPDISIVRPVADMPIVWAAFAHHGV